MRLWPRRKVYVDDLPQTHDLRFATIFLAGVAALLGTLYAVGHLLVGDRLPAGTTVSGVDIGGVKVDEARQTLRTELVPRISEPVTAKVAGRTFTLSPQEAGLTVDIDATLEEALGGGPWDPRHMLQVVTGGGAVSPVVLVDEAAVAATLRDLDRKVARPAVDATVTFPNGQPQVAYAERGRALDREVAGGRLREALLASDRVVSLPMKVVEPDISSTEATHFVNRDAQRALSAPVKLLVVDTVARVPPRIFAPTLRAREVGGVLRLSVDAEELYARSERLLTRLPSRPVSAGIVFRDDQPTIRRSRAGVTVTPKAWASAARRALSGSGAGRTVPVPTTAAEPDVKARQVRALRIESLIAAKGAAYAEGHVGDRVPLTGQLDGYTLGPGDTLRFEKVVDWSRNPRAASVLASATYDVAYRSGMTVLERTPRTYWSDEFTPGIDAAVSRTGDTLRLRNDGPFGIYIRVYVDEGSSGRVHVELWSTPHQEVKISTSGPYDVVRSDRVVDRSALCVPREGSPGFEVDVRRTLREGRRPAQKETTHTSYSPLAAVRCRT